jgi:hypothetical protein
MRCTLRRGRPNTPKTGLSQEYRARKSSVPNTPEGGGYSAASGGKASLMHNARANNTISNDDMMIHHHRHQQQLQREQAARAAVAAAGIRVESKAKAPAAKSTSPIPTSLSSCSLNTAIIVGGDVAMDDGADKISIMTTESSVCVILVYVFFFKQFGIISVTKSRHRP